MSDLYGAAFAGDLKRVQLLAELGVDKDQPNDNGWTPLNAASQNGHFPVVRYLVEQGADMEKSSGVYDRTPLISASTKGRLEVVRYLLEQGADVNKASNQENTSLHLAAQNGHREIVELLMVYGADLNATNKYGELPIDCANNKDIKKAIREEPQRRWDHQPRKRCVEQDQHSNNAAASAPASQDDDDEEEEEEQNNKRLAEVKIDEVEGKVADEDQDSEPSSDENSN